MKKISKKIFLVAISLSFLSVLFIGVRNAFAAGAGSISSITGGVVTYTGTSFSPVVIFQSPADNTDLARIYISISNSSGNVGNYYSGVTLDFPMAGGSPWNPTINFGTGFEAYTGTSLYLHVFITDAAGANTGYLMQTITFVPNGSGGPNWATIYTSIYNEISGEITNNLNEVTNDNVTNFSGLYFAKMSGADELGRITFYTGLDLTDTGTQNFLQYSLPTAMGMNAGQVWFNPGTGFAGKNATLKMNIPDYFSSFLSSMNAGSFAVREGSGGAITGNSLITNVYSGGSCGAGNFGCSIYLDVGHFTQFDIKPFLTAVHITSSNTNNTAYAKSGDIVTLIFTGSEPLTGVTIIINGQTPTSVNGGGISRTATYNITGGTTSGLLTFVIDYFDMYNNSGTTFIGTTDATSVTVDNIAPVAPVISNSSTTVASSNITLTGTSENGTRIDIYSGATFIASGNSNGTFSIVVPLVEGTNTFQAYATDQAGNLSVGSNSVTITRDTTALTSTITYTTTGLTNQNVTAYISFNKTGVTIDNNGGSSGYVFTGNGSFIFNYHDGLNTGSATATVNNIDKTPPTASVDYNPRSITNQDVIATLTGSSETITGINQSTNTFTANGSFVFTFSDLAGNTGSTTATVNRIDKTPVTGNVSYSTTGNTNQNVTATITFNKTGVTVTNNGGSTGYIFTNTGSFNFTFQDSAGNTGSTTATVTWIDKVVPTATIIYSSTGLTNGNITGTITGFSESITGLNASNYLFTGNGSFVFTFSDLVGNTGSTTATVNNIDKLAPTITIGSHTNNQTGTRSSITLTGTADDTNLSGVIVNGTNLGASTPWSTSISLTGGINAITITGTDAAGNTTSTGINIIRVSTTSNISYNILGSTSASIDFDTNISALGFVKYGTSSGSLSTTITGTTTTNHTIILSSLLADTIYYYQTYGTNAGYMGTLSSINSFATPANGVDISSSCGETVTGSAFISGSTSTGMTFNNGSCEGTMALIITNSSNTNNYLQINRTGLDIESVSGTWDGILNPPVSSSNPTLGAGGLPSSSTNNGSTTTTRTILFTVQAGSTSDSLIASGGYFVLNFVVSAGTSGDVIKLYRSSDNSTWIANTPDTTCTLDSNKVCNFRTDHLSYFSAIKETTSENGGGGGGGGGAIVNTEKDICPNGDFSSSYYDGSCGTAPTTKEGSIKDSIFSDELNDAYLYAYKIGITTMPTIQGANMTGNLIRSHMAKMMVNYAIKELGLKPDTLKICKFDDTSTESSEMKSYITLSCQLGLMGLQTDGITPKTSFDPDQEVIRADFGTVLSRTLRGDKNNGGTPYYLKHLNALKTAGIMNNISDPFMLEKRGFVMLMLMRAEK